MDYCRLLWILQEHHLKSVSGIYSIPNGLLFWIVSLVCKSEPGAKLYLHKITVNCKNYYYFATTLVWIKLKKWSNIYWGPWKRTTYSPTQIELSRRQSWTLNLHCGLWLNNLPGPHCRIRPYPSVGNVRCQNGWTKLNPQKPTAIHGSHRCCRVHPGFADEAQKIFNSVGHLTALLNAHSS